MRQLVQSLLLFAALASAGCAVGPNYHRPTAADPAKFKEAEGWKPAEPREAASGTDWWSIYGDATLDSLEKQIDISNQTLKASEAAWRQATALVSQARAGLFPTIGVSATATRSGGPGGRRDGHPTHAPRQRIRARRHGHVGYRHLGQDPPHHRKRRRERSGQ